VRGVFPTANWRGILYPSPRPGKGGQLAGVVWGARLAGEGKAWRTAKEVGGMPGGRGRRRRRGERSARAGANRAPASLSSDSIASSPLECISLRDLQNERTCLGRLAATNWCRRAIRKRVAGATSTTPAQRLSCAAAHAMAL
jgi:hypothetical protein